MGSSSAIFTSQSTPAQWGGRGGFIPFSITSWHFSGHFGNLTPRSHLSCTEEKKLYTLGGILGI